MLRQMLIDEYWAKLKPIMLVQGVYVKPQLRQTIEGIFYRLRVGCPWRDLPEILEVGMPSTNDLMTGVERGSWGLFSRHLSWSQNSSGSSLMEAL